MLNLIYLKIHVFVKIRLSLWILNFFHFADVHILWKTNKIFTRKTVKFRKLQIWMIWSMDFLLLFTFRWKQRHWGRGYTSLYYNFCIELVNLFVYWIFYFFYLKILSCFWSFNCIVCLFVCFLFVAWVAPDINQS